MQKYRKTDRNIIRTDRRRQKKRTHTHTHARARGARTHARTHAHRDRNTNNRTDRQACIHTARQAARQADNRQRL